MARHRDIRNMDYEDEYDGYDDVYGHSMDDDYYISPSNRQFIYNRDTARDSRFEHEDDIQEVDEVDELSDIDRAKLNSCIDQVKNTIETTRVPRSELVNLILKYKFNVELVVNAILEDPKYETPDAGSRDKDVTEQFISTPVHIKFQSPKSPNGSFDTLKSSGTSSFTIPKIFGSKPANLGSSPKGFVIPKLFGSRECGTKSDVSNIFNKTAVNMSPKNFTVPKIFGSKSCGTSPRTSGFTVPKLKNDEVDSNQQQFSTLSELVSSHLKNLPSETSSSSPSNHDSTLNSVNINMLKMQLSDHPKKTKSLTSNDNENKFDIDLSIALKTTGSLPLFSKNKENTLEKFDIPFISSDLYVEKKSNNCKALPCIIDIRKSPNLKVNIGKKPSKFAKILCRKYRHIREENIAPLLSFRYKFPKTVEVFSFDTQSRDDYINSHLNS